MAVLLLNASFEPLSVIPKRRAISLMLRERVDAVSAESIPLQGGQSIVDIPSVLRLRRYINVPRRGARWSRRSIMLRDNYTCIYCGVSLGEMVRGKVMVRRDFTLDHIVPKSRGGRNSWVNTACACERCNARKGDRRPDEVGLKLRWEPKIPRVDYLVASGEVPDAWKIYLKV